MRHPPDHISQWTHVGAENRRLREAKRQRDQRTAERMIVAGDVIALYRLEKAKAEERWAKAGGPSCGLSSGRHPINKGVSSGRRTVVQAAL